MFAYFFPEKVQLKVFEGCNSTPATEQPLGLITVRFDTEGATYSSEPFLQRLKLSHWSSH